VSPGAARPSALQQEPEPGRQAGRWGAGPGAECGWRGAGCGCGRVRGFSGASCVLLFRLHVLQPSSFPKIVQLIAFVIISAECAVIGAFSNKASILI